jgi:hypothetical protein
VTSESDHAADYGPRLREGLVLPPWEDRDRYGFLNGLYLTIKDVLLIPGRFFGRMPTEIGLVQPLFFAVVVGAIGYFFDWMWTLTGSSLQIFVAEDLGEVVQPALAAGARFIFSPLLVSAAVLLSSGIIHLCLSAVAGNRLGFEATFRVIAYAHATAVLALVPFCGDVVGALWSIGITVVGLYKIHETEPWRAVVAVVLPVALCLGTCGGFLLFGLSTGIFD